MENRLLACLPPDEFAALRTNFTQVTLTHGQQVIAPDEPIRDIYFPLNCLLSLITIMEDGSSVESGCIGREGMAGVPVLLDAVQTTMETVVQIPGEALKIKANTLKEAYDKRGALHKLLNRYMHTVIVVGAQTAACNALHKAEARCCRWLLMSSDGVGSNELNLTQEYLSIMLGVRRPTVTEVAIELQNEGLIVYRRGRIEILEREKLEQMVCECYDKVKEEYERLFGG